MTTELIKQAIESAKCRIYKLNFDLDGKLSSLHQKKAENQKALMEITVEALEKQIPKKPIVQDICKNTLYICPSCGKHLKRYSFGAQFGNITNFCSKCGQKLDLEEGGTSD